MEEREGEREGEREEVREEVREEEREKWRAVHVYQPELCRSGERRGVSRGGRVVGSRRRGTRERRNRGGTMGRGPVDEKKNRRREDMVSVWADSRMSCVDIEALFTLYRKLSKLSI